MSKRFDNIKLLYILGALVLVLVLTMVVKVPREKATIKDKFFDIDSTEISRIILHPAGPDSNDIYFYRKQGRWVVQQGEIVAAAQKNAVNNIFTEVLNLQPARLAANDKLKWKEYELTDSLATRISFENEKGKKLADLMIGKFSFKQSNDPYARYYGNNVQGISYVRVSGKKEIYAVNGFLPFTFNREFDEWRDNSFLQFNTHDVTKISFTGPADSSYSLVKKDSHWYIGDIMADSSNTINYLNSINWLTGQNFKDGFKPFSGPVYQVEIEGNNLLSIQVKCYKGEGTDEYILHSSLNQDVYYSSNRAGMFDKLFKPQSYFLPQKKK